MVAVNAMTKDTELFEEQQRRLLRVERMLDLVIVQLSAGGKKEAYAAAWEELDDLRLEMLEEQPLVEATS